MKIEDFNNIEQSIKKIRCTTRQQTDEQILGDCFAELGGGAQPQISVFRLILRSKVIQMVAVAVIIAVVMIGAVILAPTPAEKETARRIETIISQQQAPEVPENEQPPQLLVTKQEKEQPELTVKEIKTPPTATEKVSGTPKTRLNTELKQVIDMFTANDFNGLTAMLLNRDREIKLAAAVYLAKIGDANAADELESLSALSDDQELANIFSFSSTAIRKRLEDKKEGEAVKPQKTPVITKAAISGKVIDAETSLPVADAGVRLSNDVTYLTKTDVNGFYFFNNVKQSGEYTLTILSKQYFEKTTDIKLTEENISGQAPLVSDLQIDKACAIEITVVDEVNEPVPGAKIVVTSPFDNNEIINGRFKSAWGWLTPQETDPNGLLLLGGLKIGTYNITILDKIPDVNDANSIGWDFAPQNIEVNLEDPYTIEFSKTVLFRGVEVEGIARFADGTPAANMKIIVQPAWWHFPFDFEARITDAEGRFRLDDITADMYRIKVKTASDETNVLTVETLLPTGEDYLILTIPPSDNTYNF